jgi:hypothetical protein
MLRGLASDTRGRSADQLGTGAQEGTGTGDDDDDEREAPYEREHQNKKGQHRVAVDENTKRCMLPCLHGFNLPFLTALRVTGRQADIACRLSLLSTYNWGMFFL